MENAPTKQTLYKFKKRTRKEVKQALIDNKGIIGLAAKKLGYTRCHLSEVVNGDPELIEIARQSRGVIGDLAISKMVEKIQEGNTFCIKIAIDHFSTYGTAEQKPADNEMAGAGEVLIIEAREKLNAIIQRRLDSMQNESRRVIDVTPEPEQKQIETGEINE